MKFFTRFVIPIAVVAGVYFVITHQPTGSGSPVDKLLEFVHGQAGSTQNPLDAVTDKARKASEDHNKRLEQVEGDLYGD